MCKQNATQIEVTMFELLPFVDYTSGKLQQTEGQNK